MVLMTMLARVTDGLPLAASIQDDESDQNLVKYQNQAKLLFRKLTPQSPNRSTLESDNYIFYYIIEGRVCFLCLCDKNFSRKIAFNYLEDLANQFNGQYGTKVETVARPYHFIEFDNYMQTAKKKFLDSRARRQLTNINTELQDVQRIMVQNIEDVIHRGETLTILDDKAASLSDLSKKYRKDAKYLNLRSSYTKIGLLIILVVAFLLFIRYKLW